MIFDYLSFYFGFMFGAVSVAVGFKIVEWWRR